MMFDSIINMRELTALKLTPKIVVGISNSRMNFSFLICVAVNKV